MDKRRKIAAVLALVPLLVIAATGLTLSHWDDEVMVTGSVSMGTFNIQMSLDGVSDNEDTLDVGTVSASLIDYNDGDDVYDGGVNDAVQVTLSNVYPGYYACVIFNIENTGTIPASSSLSSIVVTFTSSFDWDTYKEYFDFNITYLGDPTDPTDDILIMYLDENGDLTVSSDYDFGADPAGIFFLDVGEVQYYKLCFGLESEPTNAPEDLMDQTVGFDVTINWIQAVP